jgi:hypothetical protein
MRHFWAPINRNVVAIYRELSLDTRLRAPLEIFTMINVLGSLDVREFSIEIGKQW